MQVITFQTDNCASAFQIDKDWCDQIVPTDLGLLSPQLIGLALIKMHLDAFSVTAASDHPVIIDTDG